MLPTSEVAADYIPFAVEGDYPHRFSASFSADEVRPGDELEIEVNAEGQAKVGLGVVDRSVYILAANRLNLAQVFEELERLYMEPQVELHEAHYVSKITTPGARETFEELDLVVLTDRKVPAGREISRPGPPFWQRVFGVFMPKAGIGKGAPMLLAEAAPRGKGMPVPYISRTRTISGASGG